MFCNRNKVKSLLKRFDTVVSDNIDVALKITTALNAWLTNPLADIVTALIPGELDNVIKSKVISALRVVIPALTICEACVEAPTMEEKLRCFGRELQKQAPNLQQAILFKLASLLAAKLDDEKLPQHLYDLYLQGKFSSAKQ